jgi:hypothetical protein
MISILGALAVAYVSLPFILPIHAAPEPEAVEVPETVVLTKTKRKELTAKAWGALEYACGMAWELDGMLDRAETFTTEGERKHRRMGRDFCEARYRLPATTAARAILLREVVIGPTFKPRTWTEAQTIRKDIAIAWALHELLNRRVRDTDDHWTARLTDEDLAAIRGFDYAEEAPA